MRRRHLLAGLATGALPLAAGCSADEGLALDGFSNHEDLDVSFTGEAVQQSSDESPPRIELRFTNEGAKRGMYFGPVLPGVFRDRTKTLTLIPDTRDEIGSWDPDAPPEFIPDSPEEGCWRALNRQVTGSYLRRETLDSGEQLTEQYTLLAHADAEECFPSGSHHFEATFKIEAYHTLSFDVVVP